MSNNTYDFMKNSVSNRLRLKKPKNSINGLILEQITI